MSDTDQQGEPPVADPSPPAADGAAAAADAAGEWPEERRRALREALVEQRVRLARASRGLAMLLIATVAVGVVLRLPEAWWMPAVGAIALGGIVLRLVSWKCPNCGERLATRRPGTVCAGCGAPLE